ncbi:hypothetical protein GCM10009677_07720 [Sphaerisporangium rubeum]|uniref:Uncharacterized protein n=1 Tax=Sphaerisporangium rubeum TaxID=321317 RepID=A0A7X0IIX6_9ACTN|nr:hypothetical protein [Sphaerisporangium rubeum]MBB6475509.1 hypothetical protein [Sphaerisporangium rubeum]
MAERREGGGGQWLLAALPGFPLALLILRLWYLSRQDLPTMLVLVQSVSPLGLISTLIITLIWGIPVMVLVGRALGGLVRVSVDDPADSWVVRVSTRIPYWTVVLAAVTAALAWQLRFLPALAMLVLAIAGFEVRARHGDRPALVRLVCLTVPLTVAVAALIWFAPAVVDAFTQGEPLLGLTILLPLLLAPLLNGPIPARTARPVAHVTAAAGALLAPLLISVSFLDAPVLPTVALELKDPGDGPAVLIGQVVSVDDTMTTLIDSQGDVRFVPNARLLSKTLCPGSRQPPYSAIEVRGWHVERTPLSWMAPSKPYTPMDSRCLGRSSGDPS